MAIHGILTGYTHPGWIDRLGHHLWLNDAGATVIKRHYAAGPFPAWNVFVKNRWLARSLANELQPYGEDGAELMFVTHSNGADIAVRTIRRLAKLGIRTETAIFIGAAISADVDRSGVRELLAEGALGKAVAYCAPDDLALRLHAIWPYGQLGRLGFQCAQQAWPNPLYTASSLIDRAFTRWFHGGHGGYFQPEREPATFDLLATDLFGGVGHKEAQKTQKGGA